MDVTRTIAIAGLAALISNSALAAGTIAIKDLPKGGNVTLSGTVDKIDNEREFVLRDSTGTIDVDIASNQSVVLEKGAQVTVNGVVDKGFFGTDINAATVTVHKGLAETIGEAIEGNTNISMEGATAVTIRNLPEQGIVKLSGIVTKVDNEKEFTLKDETGSINIDIESNEAAAVTKGAHVTVIGYVDNGVMGKDINARKVLIVSNATPVAQGQ